MGGACLFVLCMLPCMCIVFILVESKKKVTHKKKSNPTLGKSTEKKSKGPPTTEVSRIGRHTVRLQPLDGPVGRGSRRRLRPEGEVNAVREGRELAAVLVD